MTIIIVLVLVMTTRRVIVKYKDDMLFKTKIKFVNDFFLILKMKISVLKFSKKLFRLQFFQTQSVSKFLIFQKTYKGH